MQRDDGRGVDSLFAASSELLLLIEGFPELRLCHTSYLGERRPEHFELERDCLCQLSTSLFVVLIGLVTSLMCRRLDCWASEGDCEFEESTWKPRAPSQWSRPLWRRHQGRHPL